MASAGRGGEGTGDERSARMRKPGTIMIIINFTGTIGYRLYLFSTTGCPTSVFALPPLSREGKGRSCSRHTGGGLCLQVQKATTICDIKIQGRLKLQNAPARLIKNDPTRKNNRARVLSSHSYFSVRRAIVTGAIICAN
jgi:hypothetical protein